MNTDYNKQANDFLTSTGAEVKIEFLKNDYHFADDKHKRDIYKVTIKRGQRKFSFNFGQSLNNSGLHAPTSYDILACLQKYDVGSFENFCSEFGYDEDSKTAGKIYKAVRKEYDNVCKIWTDAEIEILQEIQ